MSHRQQPPPKHNRTLKLLEAQRLRVPDADTLAKMSLYDQDIALGVGLKCTGCGQPATVRIRMFMEPSEFIRRAPELAAVMIVRHDGTLPVMQTKKGPMTPYQEVGACPSCRKEAEIEAARAPSFVFADIYAPAEPAPQVAVPSGHEQSDTEAALKRH